VRDRGEKEVVKKSGRDEPMWILIHMHGNNTRIYLYSYLHLVIAKMLCFSFYLSCFLQQNQRTRGRNRSCLEAREGKKGLPK
jgi:hypothetical protein